MFPSVSLALDLSSLVSRLSPSRLLDLPGTGSKSIAPLVGLCCKSLAVLPTIQSPHTLYTPLVGDITSSLFPPPILQQLLPPAHARSIYQPTIPPATTTPPPHHHATAGCGTVPIAYPLVDPASLTPRHCVVKCMFAPTRNQSLQYAALLNTLIFRLETDNELLNWHNSFVA